MSGTTELDTTFLPDAQDARDVGDRLGRPQVGGRGVAHAVGIEREQRVGVVGRAARRRRRSRRARPRRGRPCRRRAPTPRPARDPGGSRSSRSAWRPTLPVLHWMTRYVTASPLPHPIAEWQRTDTVSPAVHVRGRRRCCSSTRSTSTRSTRCRCRCGTPRRATATSTTAASSRASTTKPTRTSSPGSACTRTSA